MSTIAIKRFATAARWAIVALPLSCLSGAEAQAQAGGGIRGHFARFYGQDFYDHQPPGLFTHGIHRRYDGGYYGPSMIYGRQYADEYDTPRDQPFVPARFRQRPGAGDYNAPRY